MWPVRDSLGDQYLFCLSHQGAGGHAYFLRVPRGGNSYANARVVHGHSPLGRLYTGTGIAISSSICHAYRFRVQYRHSVVTRSTVVTGRYSSVWGCGVSRPSVNKCSYVRTSSATLSRFCVQASLYSIRGRIQRVGIKVHLWFLYGLLSGHEVSRYGYGIGVSYLLRRGIVVSRVEGNSIPCYSKVFQ